MRRFIIHTNNNGDQSERILADVRKTAAELADNAVVRFKEKDPEYLSAKARGDEEQMRKLKYSQRMFLESDLVHEMMGGIYSDEDEYADWEEDEIRAAKTSFRWNTLLDKAVYIPDEFYDEYMKLIDFDIAPAELSHIEKEEYCIRAVEDFCAENGIEI